MKEGESAENGGISAEAIDRRLRSETILRAEGVPFFAALPVVKTEAETLSGLKKRSRCALLPALKDSRYRQISTLT